MGKNKSLKFKLIDVCYQNPASYNDEGADFFLEQDDWNDFWYYTTYHLHATPKLTGTLKSQYLGVIKILKIGQDVNQNRILQKELKSEHKSLIFSELPQDYYSISFSLDLYRGLTKLLSEEQRKLFVKSMRLILEKDSNYYKIVKSEPAFETSFLRSANIDSDVLARGRRLLLNSGEYYNWEKQKLTINFVTSSMPMELDFSGIKDSEVNGLQSGIIAFIGHNGCGKSTALYQIAKVLFASPSDRWRYKDILNIQPVTAGINKLLFFSYSAFDNFVLPGLTPSDYKLILDGLEDNNGRFVFCGVRDVKKELSDYLCQYEEKMQNAKSDENEEFILLEKQENYHEKNVLLKTIDSLADEVVKVFLYINWCENEDLYHTFREIINDSKIYLPSLYEDLDRFDSDMPEEKLKEMFMKLSTGTKFFIHALLHLIAYTEENSIVLFDEPENHLHPPFLSFMMKSFRRIIHKNHSVMLIATHSPVILQETLSKNVFILCRKEKCFYHKHPAIETYGENFGFINSYVFNLTSDMSNYYDVIDQLYEKWDCDELDSSSKVLTRFRQRFEVETFSTQMEAYLINKYYSTHVEN